MNKFLFKSSEADLQKFNQSQETLQKNVLYVTYQVDKILKILREESHDKDLQDTVDKYFDKDDKEPD